MSIVLNDIKYFIIVSNTKNVTRASEIIGISQPALSYALKRLESELGGDLFIRLKNGIRLTKLGEEFKLRSHRLLNEWEQAQNLTNPDTGFIQARYSFAIHPSVAMFTLERFLPQLEEKFPELDFDFIHGLSREMTERVINWEADFGIVVNPTKHPDLVIKRLCTDEITIFHKEGAKNKLIYDQNLRQSQYIIQKIGKKNRFNSSLSSANLEVVGKLTSLGLGHGILPSRVAAQYRGLKRLEGAPAFKDEICLTYRPEKHNNRVSKAIIKCIRDGKY